MFYFAWVDKTDNTFLPAYAREDEQVVSFNLTQSEGYFASLEIEVENPNVGLLSSSRKQWAWFSWERGPGDIVPLFFGRLIGLPENITRNIVSLAFIARPVDFETQKEAAAATLRELPFWDTVFVDQAMVNDPDRVLEARAAVWSIDRTSHLVTTTSIINGEDGTLDFDASEVINDSVVGPTYTTNPARKVVLEAEVGWAQQSIGEVNLSNAILAAFGSSNGKIETLTGHGLERTWPKKGTAIGGGWVVGTSEVIVGDMMAPLMTTEQQFFSANPLTKLHQRLNTAMRYEFRYPPEFAYKSGFMLAVPIWEMRPRFFVDFVADRDRSEYVTFTINADVQPILTDPGEEDVIFLSVGKGEVGNPEFNTTDGPKAIGDVRRRTYFDTDRGKQSIEYLINLAKSQLLYRARSASISFDVPFALAVDATIRKNASIEHPKIPGGVAAGKIKSYTFSLDGRQGALVAKIEIGCMIGRGETLSLVPGTPNYVEEGYVEQGYQTYTNSYVLSDEGDVAYQDFSGEPIDDDLDLFNMVASQVVENITVTGTLDEQLTVKNDKRLAAPDDVIAAINEHHTTISVTLKPIGSGPYRTEYFLTMTDLMIPSGINLGD